MGKLSELHYALGEIGHIFIGIIRDDGGLFMVYALDPKEANRLVGVKPKKENCRDYTDYKASLNAWRNHGTYLLYADKDLDTAIENAVLKLA